MREERAVLEGSLAEAVEVSGVEKVILSFEGFCICPLKVSTSGFQPLSVESLYLCPRRDEFPRRAALPRS